LCLENGKSVLFEKPVTVTADEVKEVIDVAEKNKKIFYGSNEN
jgi:predicted dehydrogenase